MIENINITMKLAHENEQLRGVNSSQLLQIFSLKSKIISTLRNQQINGYSHLSSNLFQNFIQKNRQVEHNFLDRHPSLTKTSLSRQHPHCGTIQKTSVSG